MTFDEAIEEIMKASTKFKQAVETACAKLSERYTELTEKPAPPERKIDRREFTGWYRTDCGQPFNQNIHLITSCLMSVDVNQLVAGAANTTRDLIDWVNEWYSHHGEAIVAPDWMRDGMIRLRQRVIDNGFECDLKQ